VSLFFFCKKQHIFAKNSGKVLLFKFPLLKEINPEEKDT